MTDAEFESVFEQHKDAVYRFAWRMTGSSTTAEDIAQEVFLVLLRQTGRFDSNRGPIRPFLLGVARNIALKRWRDEHRWEPLDEEQFEGQPLDVSDGRTAEIVGRAVHTLPPLQREVLILAEYEEMSLEAIAYAVGAEVGTVKSRLHRARQNLRRMLAPLKSEVVRSTTHETA